MIKMILQTAKTAALAAITIKVARASVEVVDRTWDRVTRK
jgi:hypothetical protein